MRSAALRVLLALTLTGHVACEDDAPLGPPINTDVAAPKEPPKLASLEDAAAELGRLSGQAVRPYSTYEYGRNHDTRCRSVVLEIGQDPIQILSQLRPRLPLGVVAFVGTGNWSTTADAEEGKVEVVVGPGADQFDYLRLARSNGINHGLDTEKLVRRLTRLHADHGIEILQAETDTVVIRFEKRPWDFSKLAKEMYELCPDLVNQGVGSMEELENYLKKNEYVQLWWD